MPDHYSYSITQEKLTHKHSAFNHPSQEEVKQPVVTFTARQSTDTPKLRLLKK